MESGTLAIPRRLLLTSAQTVYLTRSPEASNAHGVLNLGEGLFDDLSPGSFAGSASGTVLAVNAPAGFAGNLLDAQAAGTSVFSATAGGSLTSASTVSGTALIASGLTGATSASRYAGATASGAPSTGTFATGDYVVDQSGSLRVCTAGGSPGSWTAPGGTPGMQKIADSTSVSAFASVTFSSIPGTYRHLVLVVVGRGDTAATSTNILLQFNGDTATNYQFYEVDWSGTVPAKAATSSGTTPVAQIQVGGLPAASVTANWTSKFEIVMTLYADTTFFKTVHARGGRLSSASVGSQFITWQGGLWNSTAAITSIKVFLSAGNFAANSIVSLYGLG